MNNKAFFQEIGLSIVFSVALATPVHSKTLPIFNQEFNLYSTPVNTIRNLETQIYSIDLGIISQPQYDNIDQKKYYYSFPIFTEEISTSSLIIPTKKIEKETNKNFTAIRDNINFGKSSNSKQYQESKNNTLNSTNVSELISYLPDEDIQPLLSHEEKSLLLPPISEKQTLIYRYHLLKKKVEKIAEESRQSVRVADRLKSYESIDNSTTLQLIDHYRLDDGVLNSKVEGYLDNSSFTNVYSLPAEVDNVKFNISENIVKQRLEENSNSIIQNKQHQIINKDFQNIQQNNPDLLDKNQSKSNFITLNSAAKTTASNLLRENFLEENLSQKGQKREQESNNIIRVNEIYQPLTTAAALYQPDIIITNISEDISQDIRIAQQIIQVTNIRLDSTSEGLQIILETLSGEKLQVRTAVDGNTLIVDIPNAVLSLPDTEEFNEKNPIRGVTNVTATMLNSNTIQLRIEGETSLPTASLVNVDEGLTLSVKPVIEDEEIEVVIQATRRAGATEEDIPRSITVISREQIEDQSSVSATNNITDILGRTVPGYGPPPAITRRTRSQSLRGRPALILIDGVVQNSNLSNDTELNTIDPSAIERIEVIRGASALYGSGSTGGIVNIVTRTPGEGLEQEAKVGYSNFGGDEFFPYNGAGYNGRYRISGSAGDFNWGITSSLNQNNRFFDAEGDIIPTGDLDGSRSLNLLTTLGLDVNEDQRLRFKYNLYNDRLFPSFTADGENLQIFGNQKARAERIPRYDYEEPPEQTNHNISLTYDNDNLFGSQLYTQLFFQRTYLRQVLQDFRTLLRPFLNSELPDDFPALRQPANESRKLGTRIQVTTPVSKSASFFWGVDYTNEKNDTEDLVLDTEAFNEREELNVRERVTPVPNFVINSVGIFAEGQWDVTEKILLSGGARYETIHSNLEDWTQSPFNNFTAALAGEELEEFEGGTNTASDIVFNTGVVYKASQQISLFFNFSQGFSIPSFGFLGGATDPVEVDVGTDELTEPEKVHNYEIGMRGNWKSVQFTVATFYNHSDKGQNLTLGEDGFADLDRGPQRNYGVEATLDWQPKDTWRIGSTFTWNEGEGDLPGDNRGWQPLSGIEVQPMKVTLYVQNETLPNWRNRLQMLFVGDRFRAFDEEVDEFQANGYVTFDLVSTLNLGLGRFELGVQNLFNRQYIPISSQERINNNEFRYLAAPGRNISIRYFLKF
ncbi:MAG: TonB-dependent receptor [Trichodesmium sp. MO_231.B1]|nr:TonB-dependent receptor [Trichodesmium sp. MO_231.B1]